MRVLHFLWGLVNGGAENLAVDLANEQCRNSQVTLLVANDKLDQSVLDRLDPSVRFIHLRRPEGSKNPYWMFRLLAIIRSLRPDVVHSHASNFAPLGRFISAPLVLTVHANNILLSADSFRFAAICCISKAVEDDVRGRYPQLATRLVNNGVKASAIAQRKSGFSTPLRAVQVSRLAHATKGQDLLIEALSIVNKEHGAPLMTVDFIGGGASLPFLTDLAVKMNVADCCRFLGTQSRDEIFATLQCYDLLVQPSRDEGFGLTVAEGMAAGIPVVISDLAGPMEVIDSGQFGYHFISGNAVDLSTTLRRVFAEIQSPETYARLAAARQYVMQQYDLTRTAENYERVYSEVANA